MSKPAITLLLVSALGAGCGSKTGLEVGEVSPGLDASRPDGGFDAGTDAGTDGGEDAGLVCRPGVVRLDPSTVEVVFVIDRSGSMALDFAGETPRPLESRWEILELALGGALEAFDESVEVGAKFFPTQTMRATEGPCDVFGGLEVPIGPGRAAGIITHFTRYDPNGGTPVGPAARAALAALLARADENSAQFMVVATDGAPTCGEDAVGEIVSVVGEAHDVHGIDVFVLGIASPGPEHELLNRLAITGGRARPSTEPQRFYDARDPALLDSLLDEIARDLAQCVFAVPIPPDADDVVEVLIGRETIPRDESREDGWDWTSERRAQLSLFGPACDRAIEVGAVRANILCN